LKNSSGQIFITFAGQIPGPEYGGSNHSPKHRYIHVFVSRNGIIQEDLTLRVMVSQLLPSVELLRVLRNKDSFCL